MVLNADDDEKQELRIIASTQLQRTRKMQVSKIDEIEERDHDDIETSGVDHDIEKLGAD